MVYVDEAGIHDQSDASLEVYRRLGGAWRLLGLLKYVPRAIRNPAYRVLARNRYRWFGKRDTCRIPTAEEAAASSRKCEPGRASSRRIGGRLMPD